MFNRIWEITSGTLKKLEDLNTVSLIFVIGIYGLSSNHHFNSWTMHVQNKLIILSAFFKHMYNIYLEHLCLFFFVSNMHI